MITNSKSPLYDSNFVPSLTGGLGRVLIFGGTTEGRLAVEVCEQAGKPFYYSTKSSMQDVEMHNGVRLTGAMTTDDIIRFCKEHDIKCIVDAAHPFAENLHKAIADAKMPTIRLQRVFEEHKEGIVYCDGYQDAILKMSSENIHTLLALSGANTISKLSPYWHHHKTIFRILQRQESIDIALKNEFPTSNLIFYNTDYTLPSKEDEKMMMQNIGCDAIITKESGESGGFDAKVNAALELGLKVFVVEAPQPPKGKIVVTGRYGLRRAIEQLVPEFFPLKTGFTTGACATAATKAALLSLLYEEPIEEVSFALPDGEIMTIPIQETRIIPDGNASLRGWATVIKDSSDDPDVTRGCKITASVSLRDDDQIIFLQGDGVGKVTLPGLGIPVGEPAINPTPRKMIINEIKNVLKTYSPNGRPLLGVGGFNVTISVENGEEIAKHTFNPKVGVVGGISIIGTSGIVSPLSNEAFIQSIKREMEVAKAMGCSVLYLVSGKKSEDYLKTRECSTDGRPLGGMGDRYIHYGNFIGESLKAANELGFPKVVLGIMIGKAVKLADGHLDTHSHKVQMNKEFLKSLSPDYAAEIDSITLARELWHIMPPAFFDKITTLCYSYCKTVFPSGELEIKLICDDQLQ